MLSIRCNSHVKSWRNQKSDKVGFIIYADLECLIEKTAACKNNPQNLFTIKVSKNMLSFDLN